MQRYESSISPDVPRGSLHYMDRAGERLFAKDTVNSRAFSVSAYLRAVLTKPGVFAGIYARHVINGMDVRDGEVYTKELSKNKPFRSALNFLIVFLGLAVILTSIRFDDRNNLAIRLICGAAILLPVLLAIPGAIETRYFLPLHLAIYCALAFNADVARRLTVRQWLIVAAAFILSASVFFFVTTATMSTLQFEYPATYR